MSYASLITTVTPGHKKDMLFLTLYILAKLCEVNEHFETWLYLFGLVETQ